MVNLAPFSAFTFVSPKPPMLAISVGRKGGIYKDTAQNILNNEEYVVHIADSSLMTAVHESSTEHPPDVSEVEELRLSTLPGERVKVPRLAAAPIAMECRFRQCLEFGETRSRLIVGEVLVFHIRDGLLNNGKIETEALDPIARIAGPRYAQARRDRHPEARVPDFENRILKRSKARRRLDAALIRRSTACIS